MSEATKHRTVLGEDCQLDGEFLLESSAVIKGRINGCLRLEGELELPQPAHVTGTIVVGWLQLARRVEADVVASESMQLHPGAQLTGRIYTPKLSMGHGVIFQGEAFVGPDAMSIAQQMLDENDQACAAQWLSDRLQDQTCSSQNAPSGSHAESATYPPYQNSASDGSQTYPGTVPASQPALESLDPAQTPSEQTAPTFGDNTSSISLPDGAKATDQSDDGIDATSPPTTDKGNESSNVGADIKTNLNSVQSVLRRRRSSQAQRQSTPDEAT